MTKNIILIIGIVNLNIICIDLPRKLFLESRENYMYRFYTFIRIEISGQSYILKTVSVSKTSLVCGLEGAINIVPEQEWNGKVEILVAGNIVKNILFFRSSLHAALTSKSARELKLDSLLLSQSKINQDLFNNTTPDSRCSSYKYCRMCFSYILYLRTNLVKIYFPFSFALSN